jgi:outer membrane protein TolC
MISPIFTLPILLALQAGAQPPAITVDEAVRLALQHGPRMKTVRAEAGVAQAQNERDKPEVRPIVKAIALGTLNGPTVRIPGATSGETAVIPARYGRLELNLEQPLWHAGLGSAKEKYSATRSANDWDARRAQADVAQGVQKACFDFLIAQEMLTVAEQGYDVAKKQRDQVALMLESGLSSERDLKAADATVAEAHQHQIQAANGFDLARAELNRQLGRSLDELTTVKSPRLLDPTDFTLEKAIEWGLRDRPEVHALEEGIRAAKAGASLAGTQDKPELSFRATAARQTPTALTDANYYSAGFAITWNLFDAGKAKSDQREARAQVAKMEAQLEELKSGIRMEVRKAWRDIETARALTQSTDRQTASANAALTVSQARYAERAALLLEVQGAMVDLQRAKANHAQAFIDMLRARATLDYAIGLASK